MNKNIIPALKMIYPYDNTAQDKGNYIPDDVKVIPPNGGKVVAASKGAFYADSLVIRKGQETLQLGRDYELAGFYQQATEETGKPVNVLVVFKDHIDGEVRMSYQVVGGIFIGVWETVQDYINILLVDPRKQRWDDILDKPELYAPMDHYHDINDTYGWDVLPYKISELTSAVTRVRSREMRLVYERILQIKRNTEELITTRLASLDKIVANALSNNTELSQLKVAVRTINDFIAALGDAEELLSKLDSIDSKITKATAKVKSEIQNSIVSDLDNLIQNYNTLKGKVDQLTTDVTNLKALTATVNNLSDRVNTLDTTILRDSKAYTDAKFNTANNNLDTAIRGVKDITTGLTEQLEELKTRMERVGGLCQEFGNLPKKGFSKGTSVLARDADGNCYQMVTPENLFQDVGVKISSGKVSVDVDSPFHVKYIVTNSGLATNEKAILTIVLPQQNYKTPYTIGDFQQVLQKGTRYVKISDTQYEIYGLQSGGTFTVTFTLTPRTFGTYQLGGQVTVNTEYDLDTSNNQASLFLTANTVVDSNYIASVNCPMIVAKSPDGGKQYIATKTINENNRLTVDTSALASRLNVINAKTVNNFKVKLENFSTVYVKYVKPEQLRSRHTVGYIKYNREINENNVIFIPFAIINEVKPSMYLSEFPLKEDLFGSKESIKRMVEGGYYRYAPGGAQYFAENLALYPLNNLDANAELVYNALSDNFTLEDGVVTFKGDARAALLLCRPRGDNCVWQSFIFTTKTPYRLITNTDDYVITGIPADLYAKSQEIVYSEVINPKMRLKDSNEEYIGYYLTKKWDNGHYEDNFEVTKTVSNKYVINLQSNTVYNFTIKKTRGTGEDTVNVIPFPYPKAKGNINFAVTNKPDGEMDYITVTTTNQVTSTDNVTFDNITINFV